MATSISRSRLEDTIKQLESAFRAAGEEGIPSDLESLLRSYSGGAGEEGRKAMYKRLYGVLWYGSGKTLGAPSDGSHPTYVYPSALKAVIRARYPDVVKDWVDPTGPKVYHLTYGDLARAKWPVPSTAAKIGRR